MTGFLSNLFVTIPLFATLCNLFLLLTFMSAKKDRLIRSFMLLLICLSLWPLASLFMRLSLYPGVVFWFQVSMSSIICVPLAIYLFLHHYTKSRGSFLLIVFNVGTVLMIVLNALEIFITDIEIVAGENGQSALSYGIGWPSVFLILFAAAELVMAARLIYRSVAKGGQPSNNFRPLFVGICIMCVAMVLDLIPGLAAVFPVDPFACMINALLIYYMLYRKRVFTLTQFASDSSTYLVSTVLTTLILFSGFRSVERFLDKYLSRFQDYKMLLMAVIFSLLTILVFMLLKRLANNLFVKGEQARENTLKNFSYAINKTLNQSEIISVFTDVVRENVDVETAYIFVRGAENRYKMLSCTDKMRSTAVYMEGDSPLIKWLLHNRESVTYSTFKYTSNYKSMWETEKETLNRLQVEFILPVLCDEALIGVVLLSAKRSKKPYSYSEVSFLESVASMVSIAMKNADLYETIREEAQLDPLTNIYNRRCFAEKFETMLVENKQNLVTLLLLNFDDFRLYNELYGSVDGDNVLIQFAEILRMVIGSRGLIGRYGGKEFSVCLPLCSSEEASMYVEKIRDNLNSVLNSTLSETKKFLTFSAGICTYPSAASNTKQMITYANMAVDTAKKSGKNKTVIYSKKQAGDVNGRSAQNVEAIGQEYASTIYALTAAIDAKDHYTFSHSKNVSYLATQLAQAIGLDDEHVEMIRQAGLLHDIGKISIPETILTKKARLTNEEYEIMKGHVTNSISMIRHLPSLDYVIPIAISHHERYDGRGYPRGLAGESIPLGGRVLGVVDAFDAIVSKRPYKDAMTIDDALAEIERNLGKQFDPMLGQAFVDLVRNGTIRMDCYE